MSIRSEVTELLLAWSGGDGAALDLLIPKVFDELRAIARRQLMLERADHTLQPTEIVNELYLKLVDQRRVKWENRRDFFGIAARLIRHILVDHARKRLASKRGSNGPKVVFEEVLGMTDEVDDPQLVALDDAMNALEKVDPRGHQVVELHVFTGLRHEEIAEHLNISRSTVIRDWNHAKLWLRRELGGG